MSMSVNTRLPCGRTNAAPLSVLTVLAAAHESMAGSDLGRSRVTPTIKFATAQSVEEIAYLG